MNKALPISQPLLPSCPAARVVTTLAERQAHRKGPDLACRTDSFDSTAIDHTFYCSDGTLEVTFTTQDTEYTYCDVPKAVYFDGLLKADSAGSYFNDNIRDRYDTAKNGEC